MQEDSSHFCIALCAMVESGIRETTCRMVCTSIRKREIMQLPRWHAPLVISVYLCHWCIQLFFLSPVEWLSCSLSISLPPYPPTLHWSCQCLPWPSIAAAAACHRGVQSLLVVILLILFFIPALSWLLFSHWPMQIRIHLLTQVVTVQEKLHSLSTLLDRITKL